MPKLRKMNTIRFKDKITLSQRFLDTKQQKANWIYVIITGIAVILSFVFYTLGTIDSFIGFMIATIFSVATVVAYLAYRTTMKDEESDSYATSYEQYLFYGALITASALITFAYDMVFDFRLWSVIGLADSWMQSYKISLNLSLILLMVLGVLIVWRRILHRGDKIITRKGKEVKQASEDFTTIILSFAMIVVPFITMFLIIPAYPSDVGFLGVIVGQGIDDWFAYVFYILFNAPIPAFMIAFMTIATVGVIIAQNLPSTAGKVISGVALGIASIIPLLIVWNVITGGVPPPDELESVLGLGGSVASFIYGMGLILSYIISMSIMGVFITASRAFMIDFG